MRNQVDKATKQRQQINLQKRYGQRITIAKQGREYFLKKDYPNAIRKYHEYLGILTELNELEDIFQLGPRYFDPQKQVTEMLLISHVYWELSRTYEMIPKFQPQFDKSLDQFVKFTINQPYQVFNAEMLRKYIKKNKLKSMQISKLNSAYQKIYVQSKKCYIATHCFGSDHHITKQLRVLKNILLQYQIGRAFVRWYYLVSPSIVSYADKHNAFNKLLTFAARPPLSFIAKFITTSKIK